MPPTPFRDAVLARATLVWLTLAALAISGFAAFRASDTTARVPETLGSTTGKVAAGTTARPRLAPVFPADVERWRPLIALYFEPDEVDLGLAVVACESSGRPGVRNARSDAAGLFQHLPEFWEERASQAGWPGASPLDPSANVAVAAWLVSEGGGWGHWEASRPCWDPSPIG